MKDVHKNSERLFQACLMGVNDTPKSEDFLEFFHITVAAPDTRHKVLTVNGLKYAIIQDKNYKIVATFWIKNDTVFRIDVKPSKRYFNEMIDYANILYNNHVDVFNSGIKLEWQKSFLGLRRRMAINKYFQLGFAEPPMQVIISFVDNVISQRVRFQYKELY